VSTLAAGLQILEDRGLVTGRWSRAGCRAAADALAFVAAPLGFLVAGYTGVLLAATAVPLWSKRPGLLGPLFVASAMASGAAAVSATLAVADDGTEDGLLRFEATAGAAEGVLLTAWVFALGQTARPLVEGRIGTVVRHGVIGGGVAMPLLIAAVTSRLPRRLRRGATIASALLTLTGTLALRYAVVYGGRESANDPRATFDLTG
jgi:formate-dependent nitrite reductase membrane component NrfD